MKKILGWIAVAIVVLVLLSSYVVYVSFGLRQQELADREPVTLEALAEVSERMAPPTVFGEVPEGSKTVSALDASAEDDASVTSVRPTRLEERPSSEMLVTQFARPAPGLAIMVGGVKVIESALRTLGPEDVAREWAWEAGRDLMWAGEWDGARDYFYDVLDAPHPTSRYRDACGRLAWMEDDPERAVHFLELSCDESWLSFYRGVGDDRMLEIHSGNLETSLSNAVELCRATGSDALAEHYLERLRALRPEAAREFDVEVEEADS